MYRVLTIVNAVVVMILTVFVFQDSSLDGEKFTSLKAENMSLNEQNQALREELVELRDDVSRLHFELAKTPAQTNYRPHQMVRDQVDRVSRRGAADQVPDDRSEDFDVWTGVDEALPHAYAPVQYDSINTEIDREALSKRDCYAEGKGVIGMFAAMTRKCPDWYLGDGIIVID